MYTLNNVRYFKKNCQVLNWNDNLGNPQILKLRTHIKYQFSETSQGKLIQRKCDFREGRVWRAGGGNTESGREVVCGCPWLPWDVMKMFQVGKRDRVWGRTKCLWTQMVDWKKGKESETEVAWPSVVIFIVLLWHDSYNDIYVFKIYTWMVWEMSTDLCIRYPTSPVWLPVFDKLIKAGMLIVKKREIYSMQLLWEEGQRDPVNPVSPSLGFWSSLRV